MHPYFQKQEKPATREYFDEHFRRKDLEGLIGKRIAAYLNQTDKYLRQINRTEEDQLDILEKKRIAETYFELLQKQKRRNFIGIIISDSEESEESMLKIEKAEQYEIKEERSENGVVEKKQEQLYQSEEFELTEQDYEYMKEADENELKNVRNNKDEEFQKLLQQQQGNHSFNPQKLSKKIRKKRPHNQKRSSVWENVTSEREARKIQMKQMRERILY